MYYICTICKLFKSIIFFVHKLVYLALHVLCLELAGTTTSSQLSLVSSLHALCSVELLSGIAANRGKAAGSWDSGVGLGGGGAPL